MRNKIKHSLSGLFFRKDNLKKRLGILILVIIPFTFLSGQNITNGQKFFDDIRPNPNSPEGIELLRQYTLSKVISVDNNIESDIGKVITKFFRSIKSGNVEEYKSICVNDNRLNENVQFFNIAYKDYRNYNIKIDNFSFLMSKLDREKGTAKAIIVNEQKILTGEIDLELDNLLGWKIASINQ